MEKKQIKEIGVIAVYDWMTVDHAIHLIDRIHSERGVSMQKICEMAGISTTSPSKWRKVDPDTYSIKEETQIKLWKMEKEFFGE